MSDRLGVPCPWGDSAMGQRDNPLKNLSRRCLSRCSSYACIRAFVYLFVVWRQATAVIQQDDRTRKPRFKTLALFYIRSSTFSGARLLFFLVFPLSHKGATHKKTAARTPGV